MNRKSLILTLLILTLSCKYFESEVEKPVEKKVVAETNQSVPLSIKAVALFSVGKSTVNGKKIQRGDILDLSEKILVEPKSFLDIEFVEQGVVSVLRIKGKAVFQMKAEKEGEAIRLKPHVHLGIVLFNIKKMKKQDSYQVFTPTMVAGVRGTQFQMTVKEDGSSILKLSEGEVTSHLRLDAIDSLQEKEVLKKSDLVSELVKPLDEETVLKPGEETDITRKEVDAFLKKSGLEELMKDPNLIKNIGANTDSPESKEELRKSLDAFQDRLKQKNLDMAKSFEETDKEIKSILKTQVDKQKKILEAEFKELSGIKEEIIEKADKEEIKKAITENIKENNSELMNRIETVMNKEAETVLIKGGKKVKGILIKNGADYTITTVEGEVFLPAGDLEGAVF